jgi:hypothetical protein
MTLLDFFSSFLFCLSHPLHFSALQKSAVPRGQQVKQRSPQGWVSHQSISHRYAMHYFFLAATICVGFFSFATAINGLDGPAKVKHILQVGYHPLPVDERYTASVRYHSHERASATASYRSQRKRDSRFLQDGSPYEDCEEEPAPIVDIKSKLNGAGMRFDHAWDIFVGWVDNAKSDSEVSLLFALRCKVACSSPFYQVPRRDWRWYTRSEVSCFNRHWLTIDVGLQQRVLLSRQSQLL